MTLAEIIKAYREAQGLSQRQFAARCGLSNAYISKIEAGSVSGRNPYKLETLLAIAEGLRMTPEELLAKVEDLPISIAPASAKTAYKRYTDEKRQRLVESVKDMTDDQVDLLQQLVDQILRQR